MPGAPAQAACTGRRGRVKRDFEAADPDVSRKCLRQVRERSNAAASVGLLGEFQFAFRGVVEVPRRAASLRDLRDVGIGLIASATAADALALRYLPLTPAFTSIAYHVKNKFVVLIFS